MKIKFAVILFLVISLNLIANLVNVDYYINGNKMQLIIENDRNLQPSEVDFGWNDSQNVYYLTLKNTISKNSFLPVSKGPLEGLQIVTINNDTNVFLFYLVPVKVDWIVMGNKIVITMPVSVSDKKYSFSFLDAPLDVVIRDFSDAIGVNISLYDGVRNKNVNLEVNDVSIEDALRLLLLNNPDVCYAYGPDGTLYLGLENEIKKNFAYYWQIYYEEIDSEKIRLLLGAGTFANYIKDKSKLFVYGGIREHRLIADAISQQPSKSWYYFKFNVSKEVLEDFLTNISSIYDFKYSILYGLRQVAIYSDNESANTIGYLISILKDSFDDPFFDYVTVEVGYPERIKTILESLNIPFKSLGQDIKVPEKFRDVVIRLNNDRTIGNPYRMVFEDINVDTVKRALEYLSVSEENGKVLEVNGKVFVTLFVTKQVYSRFMQFLELASVKTLRLKINKENLKLYDVEILKEFSDGSFLIRGKEKVIDEIIANNTLNSKFVLEITPFDPPKAVFKALLDASPVYETDNLMVFNNANNDMENKVKEIRESYGEKIQFIENIHLNESQTKILKDLYNIEVINTEKGVILKGRQISKAFEFINNYFGNSENKYYLEKINLQNYEELQGVISQLYKVNMEYYPKSQILILNGSSENVEKAREFVRKYSQGKSFKILNNVYFDGIDELLKEVGELKVFKINNNVLLLGSQSEIDEAETLLENLTNDSTIVSLASDLDEAKINELLNLYFGNSVIVKKIDDKFYLKGNKKLVYRAIELLKEFSKNQISFENGRLYIDVKNYDLNALIKKVFLLATKKIVILDEEINKKVDIKLSNASIEDFEKLLNEYGIFVREENGFLHVGRKLKSQFLEVVDNKITINATNISIEQLAREIYPKFGYSVLIDSVTDNLNIVLKDSSLDEFENIISSKVDITKEGSMVFIKPKGQENVTNVSGKNVNISEDGLITINAENVPLKNIIEQVVKGYKYSAVISREINSIANIYVQDITFDDFETILSNYNVAIKKENGIYIFDMITGSSTKTTTTFVFSVSQNVDKVKELIEFYGGQSFVDTSAGVVIATGIDAKVAEEVRSYIKQNLNAKLALIEVKVVDEELSDNFEYNLGKITSDLGTLSNDDFNVKLSLSNLSIEGIINKLLSIGSDGNSNLNIEIGNGNNVTNKNTNVLASPNVVAKSGEKASILIGDKIPIVLSTAENTQEIKYIESGVTLEITPYINADNTIDLELNIKVSSFDWDLKSQYSLSLPVERTREFSSKILLKENQTLVIGGLSREENSKTVSKIPILGDLPIIGKFFVSEKSDKVKRNIVIFISAKVVK
ncbi:MAG: ral secretion pathway protein [Thermosipho sp. (in: thermotogales)]|nr:ral secretion pathway protein [Thermosipho sp. (in: thermotogales)]